MSNAASNCPSRAKFSAFFCRSIKSCSCKNFDPNHSSSGQNYYTICIKREFYNFHECCVTLRHWLLGSRNIGTIAAKIVRPEQHLNLVFFIVKNVVGNIRRYSNVPVWNNHTENIPIFWKYEQVRDLNACKIVHYNLDIFWDVSFHYAVWTQ